VSSFSRRRAELRVFLGGLGQDQPFQRQNGDGPPQTCVLLLKFLQAPHLVALQGAILPPTAAIGRFDYANLTNGFAGALYLLHGIVALFPVKTTPLCGPLLGLDRVVSRADETADPGCRGLIDSRSSQDHSRGSEW